MVQTTKTKRSLAAHGDEWFYGGVDDVDGMRVVAVVQSDGSRDDDGIRLMKMGVVVDGVDVVAAAEMVVYGVTEVWWSQRRSCGGGGCEGMVVMVTWWPAVGSAGGVEARGE
ncbi:hypothetical protein Tco_0408184 [Tanacetum coccineum]